MRKLILGGACAVVVTLDVGAAVLAKGEIVCRNERALSQYQEAMSAEDERTMQWLRKGAACFEVPEDTPVARVESGERGNHAFRTTERRRNLTLWASEASTRSG